jgi:hypothetical protein
MSRSELRSLEAVRRLIAGPLSQLDVAPHRKIWHVGGG